MTTLKFSFHSINDNQINYILQASATPLQRAAAEGHVDIVHQLLKHGADVNHQDSLVRLFLKYNRGIFLNAMISSYYSACLS